MNATSAFRVATTAGVAHVTVNRKPVNALRRTDFSHFVEIMQDMDEDVHAVVLRAEGEGFGGGNDRAELAEPPAGGYRAYVADVHAAVRAIWEARPLTISLVHGYCVGSSALLAISCDVCIMTRDAYVRLPELEVSAPGGYRLLRERVRRGVAMDLLLSGRSVAADEALALGLADRLVEPDEREAAVTSQLQWFGPGRTWQGTDLVDLVTTWDRVGGLELDEGYARELDEGASLRSRARAT